MKSSFSNKSEKSNRKKNMEKQIEKVSLIANCLEKIINNYQEINGLPDNIQRKIDQKIQMNR